MIIFGFASIKIMRGKSKRGISIVLTNIKLDQMSTSWFIRKVDLIKYIFVLNQKSSWNVNVTVVTENHNFKN